MNENKINKNNDELEQIDNREQKSQGSIDLDDGVIQLPVSTFKKILEQIFKDSEKLNDEYKLDQKSKTKVSISDVEMDLTNKVLPIKTEFDKTLRNEQYLFNTTRKRKLDQKLEEMFANKIIPSTSNNKKDIKTIPKPESKSKTITKNNIIPATSKNKKDSENDWLKTFKTPKIEKSRTTNLSNCQTLVKTIPKPESKSKTITTNNIIPATIVKSRTNCQSLSETIQKPEPKSITKFENNIIQLSNSKNKKDSENNCLNKFKIPEVVKSRTNCQSLSETIQKPEPKSITKFENNIIQLSNSKNKKDSENNCLNKFKIPEVVKSRTNCQSLSETIQKPEPKSITKFENNIIQLSNSKNKKDSENNCLNKFKIPEVVKSRTNCQSLSETIQKPEPKSITKFENNIIQLSNSKNKKDSENNCLNKFKIPEVVKSRTNCQSLSETIQKPDPKSETITILSNSISVKKLEVSTNNVKLSEYPPPLFPKPLFKIQQWKAVPPIPILTVETSGNIVTLTWDLNLCLQSAQIKLYELFTRKEVNADSHHSMWKKEGVIKPRMLPMTCKLINCHLGYTYHFALRAVDVHNRRTCFALQKTKI
ncbi:activating transcription factor 7-interacting protein 2-like [Rhopalosiphum maidis]|uniref:activating transcription factor 7-interacting protein 2-like n=1 Tax=Rhopalosiphum maidis TaxID=43146 RepID=UPI000F0022A3|nr:activating transcription factor 7-interacting protein 2-like [Rhopalosiphum maidis]